MQLIPLLRRLGAPALLWGSVILVRLQVVADLRLGFSEALAAQVHVGWIYDLAAVALVTLVAGLLTQLSRRAGALAWYLGAAFLWFASGCNAGHFHFFGTALDWWVVRLHSQDLADVTGSAAEYALSPLVAASGLLLAGSFVARSAAPLLAASSWRTRVLAVLPAFALMAVCLRLPEWVDPDQPSMVVSEQVWRLWYYQNTHKKMHAGVRTDWMEELGEGRLEPAGATLAAFRDFVDGTPPAAPETYPGDYPLVRQLPVDTARSRQRRAELGLPTDGPLNVIVLLLETVRVFEIEHPALGPAIFPRLRALFAEHALYFPQTYTSSFITGQTARAQFSTGCSLLPNVLGAAPSVAHPTVRADCLQALLRANGYRTAWMNSHKSNFHGSRQFEMLHGTELFFDEAHFLERGVTQRIGDWGLADKPFLHEALGTILELAGKGAPVFTELLTLSTHHPHSVIAEGPLTPELLAGTKDNLAYRGYLSRLRYEDDAVASFFAELFKSPLAANTVVVLLGDHSTSLWSSVDVDPVQRVDQRFRIPMAIITRDMPSPRRIEHPVHQMDVAPTIAELLGVGGEVTWVGRSLFGEEGTPFVYQHGDELHYRTKSTACYTLPGQKEPACWDTRAADPLFAAKLTAVPQDRALSDFFRRVMRADRQAIALNQIAPAPLR